MLLSKFICKDFLLLKIQFVAMLWHLYRVRMELLELTPDSEVQEFLCKSKILTRLLLFRLHFTQKDGTFIGHASDLISTSFSIFTSVNSNDKGDSTFSREIFFQMEETLKRVMCSKNLQKSNVIIN